MRLMPAICLLLAGCATQPGNPIRNAWTPPETWWAGASVAGGQLAAKDGSIRSVSGMQVANLRHAYVDLSAISGVRSDLSIVDMDSVNALSSVGRDGINHIAFSLPMLERLGNDRDALAAITGHELAHLLYGHGTIRKQRADTARTTNQVVGTVLAQIIPFGGLLTSLGTSLVTTAFSRDEERQADEQGLEWAAKAGYDPCGSARAMRLLEQLSETTPMPFLSSHPGHQERIDRAVSYAKRSC